MHGDEEQLFKGDACRAEVQSPRHAYHSREVLRWESGGEIKDNLIRIHALYARRTTLVSAIAASSIVRPPCTERTYIWYDHAL